jgi:UDP-3-O-[3-hydroxymyristoyl] glucosamine N-acyltransferase
MGPSRRPRPALTPTLAELAARLDGEVLGDGSVRISGAAGLTDACEGDIVRVETSRHLRAALASPAAAFLIGPDIDPANRPAVRVVRVKTAFARLLGLLFPERMPLPGTDPTARIASGVTVGEDCFLGPHVVLSAGVMLGRGVILHPHVCLGEDVQVGDETVLFPHVTVYERVVIGRRVRIHAGAAIGADGFGYANEEGEILKVPQIGTVVIEDDVEIGANTCIDRATTGETRIGARTRIDNLVQVGHNVRIGRDCLIAGLVGISGSCVIEDDVVLGGQAGLKDHIHIAPGTMVAAQSGVWGDLPPGALYSGRPARPHREELRAQAAVSRLGDTMARLRDLERRLAEMEARSGPK